MYGSFHISHARISIPGECVHFGAAIWRVAFPDTWTTSTDSYLNSVEGAWAIPNPKSVRLYIVIVVLVPF